MSGPAELVNNAYSAFFGYATSAFNTATQTLEQIQNFTIAPVTADVTFTNTPNNDPAFTLPAAPTDPMVNFAPVSLPVQPTFQPPSNVLNQLPVAPTFDRQAPSFAIPPRPSALSENAPTDAPVIGSYALPEAPNPIFPGEPNVRELMLPDAPNVALPTFLAMPPNLDIAAPTVGVTFVESPYSSTLLSQVTARVQTMLAGGAGLPAAVEAALFGRARDRISLEARRDRQQAFEQWSSRGFSEPGGELAARLQEVTQREQDQASSANRDILIRASDIAVENLRFAVAQSIGLESILIQQAGAIAQRALDVQRLTLQTAVEVFNARVALYNAGIAGFQAQAEVYRTRIDGERQKVELYRAQLEGQRTIGELNQIEVQAYAERVRALLAMVNVYESQVRGFTARVESDKARVDAFRARVDAYGQQVQAKRAEFEAYGEEVRAQTAALGGYQAETAAFAERVRAYSATVDAKLAPLRLEIDQNRATVEMYQARLQAVREQVNLQTQTAQTAIALYDGQSRMFDARVRAEAAKIEAGDRRFQLAIDQNRVYADVALKNVSIASENAQRSAALTLESLKTTATVSAQLAAGALSAVNLSASISGNSSDSRSLGVSYTVDGGEGPPPPM